MYHTSRQFVGDSPGVSMAEPGLYDKVLVAVLKEPRDLQRAREEHWYRIPVARLPQRAREAPVLAFYQPKAFGPEERWAIRYYAPVECWERKRRVEIIPQEPDHPRAQEWYYQVRLGPLQTLPHPITSVRWRRITFIVTHWQRLLDSNTVEQILHGSLWDESLWKAMRGLGYLAEHVLKEVRAWFGGKQN